MNDWRRKKKKVENNTIKCGVISITSQQVFSCYLNKPPQPTAIVVHEAILKV